MTKATVVILVLAATAPAFAQTRPNSQATARFGALRPADSDPYRKLFQPIKPLSPTTTPAKPTIVCGMTVIPADPKIDPKMLLMPKSDGIDHKIRAIDPPICNPAR